MKKSSAVQVVFWRFVVTIFVVNAEVFGSAVVAKCTAQTGQSVCADLHVDMPGLPTTRGISIDLTPPF